ncbi:peptidylprolyl isomerase [Rosistilla ulvae]|nr:peptidylprolyl isomerase [Rosistilla ulvae]
MGLRNLAAPLLLTICFGTVADAQESEADAKPAAEQPAAEEAKPAVEEPAPDEPKPAVEEAAASEEKPAGGKTEAAKKAQAVFDQRVEEWRKATQALWTEVNEFHTARGDVKFSEQIRWAERESAARDAMQAAFLAASNLVFEDHENRDGRTFLAQSILYHAQTDWYEGLKQGALAMLEAGVKDIQLNVIAGVSAAATGDFEVARGHLKEVPDGDEGLAEVGQRMKFILDPLQESWEKEQKLREAEAKADDLPRVLLKTTRGEVLVELFENEAPNTVASFISLVEDGFYDNVPFYQVVEHEFAQTGDRDGDGSGTADYRLPDEAIGERGIFRGSLVMAKIPNPNAARDPDASGTIPNTGSSQFLITLLPFNPEYKELCCFGRVVSGMGAISTLNRAKVEKEKDAPVVLPDSIIEAEVVRKRDHEYKPETLPY